MNMSTAGTVLLEVKRPNSLGEGQESYDRFALGEPKVYFSFCYLFDASTDEWGSGSAEFTRVGFARCLAGFRVHGEAQLHENQCSVAIGKTEEGVSFCVTGFGEGGKCVESFLVPEIPESMYEALGVV